MDCFLMTRGIRKQDASIPRKVLRAIYVEMQKLVIREHYPLEALQGKIGTMPTPSGHLPNEVKTVRDCIWFSMDGLGEEMEPYL